MYGDNDYRFFSSAYPNDTYENVSVRGAPFDPRVMYPPRGPPPAPSSGRRNDGPHGQPADPAPAHTGFRPASHLSYQAAPWPTSNISASTYTYNNRTYPRYQAGSARPAATAPAQSAPPPSSTGRSTSQPSSSTTHRTPSHTHSGSTATRIQPVRAASSSRETDEITKKNKEIEQQETVLKEIAEDRKKLDTKEQEARLKIANLRNEITALARQQQQREDAQQRAQQIQQHQQQQQLRLQQQQQQQLSGSTTGQVPGYVPPIGTQYQDPRSFASLVNAVRSAPSALPYQSSTNVLSIASVNFSKLNQRYNVITTGDFLRSQVFIPRNASKFHFNVPSPLIQEKVLLRICCFDRSKKEQADHISCRLSVLVNTHQVFPSNGQQKKAPLRGPLDVTSKVIPGTNVVEIREVVPPTGASPDPLPMECGISIVKAYKLDKDATLKLLDKDPKYCRAPEETLRMIKSQFIASDSIDVTDVKVPLTCPLTKKRLELPCFGANCKHLYFFDGKSFVEMHQSRDEWSCPHCKTAIGMDELRVDGLIRKILSECKPAVTQIAFDKNGIWKPVGNSDETSAKSDRQPEASTVRDGDIIVLDDSDEDVPFRSQVPRGETTERTTPPDAGDDSDSEIVYRRRQRRKRPPDSDMSDDTAESSESEDAEEGEASDSSESEHSSALSSSSSSSSDNQRKKSSGKRGSKSHNKQLEKKRKPGPKSRTTGQKKKKKK